MADENAGQRAMAAVTQLQKIGFVEFTVELVRGVYEVIVKASMDQLKAYADFVASVAKTLEEYRSEAVGKDDTERKEKADSYIKEVLGLSIDTDPIALNDDQKNALIEHFSGMKIQITEGSEEVAIENVISETKTIDLAKLEAFVLEKLKKNAEDSYNLMVTILKIGMQKVVVTNGQIRTKLTFHVDASDTYSKTSMDYKTRSSRWGVRGGIASSILSSFIGGGISGGYGGSKLNVSVVNEKSTAATNITVDIIGEVNIYFRTDTFPATGV